MKFIHAADVHLDSPLRGLERYEGAPLAALRCATRRAFENLITLALTEAVDVVVLAGDLYDGEWKDYRTGLFFAQQMARLQAADIPVCLIAGNHDAASHITRVLRLPKNVHVFATTAPETKVFESLGVAVHGQGFATRAVTDDLSRNYPLAHSDLFNIGVLHTALDGRPGHEPYAPCSIAGLRSQGYHYWALGHVHQHSIISQAPWIVYPGNVQGRHSRELGAKGAVLVEVSDGAVSSVTFHSLDVVRWAQCVIDLSAVASLDDGYDAIEAALRAASVQAEERLLAVRVRLNGNCALHAQLHAHHDQIVNNVRALTNGLGASEVWLERVMIETTSAAAPAVADRHDALGDLLRLIRDLELDRGRQTALVQEVEDLNTRLPAELRGGDDAFDLSQPAVLQGCLDEVKALLMERLLG
ncbi:DNA repair exonuclease [Chromatium okenii]|uniref:metallophosphoesterase n=1 Tax=Chromatium okenii TaxID=61644 RepID=UPI001903CA4E|nr:DNA repair exonuclease [Chromatium okenii]